IFSGATNTPLACTLMGVELFGATHIVYIATACFLAYLFSGHSGIYLSQRVGIPKSRSSKLPPEISLRHVRDMQVSAMSELTASFANRNGATSGATTPLEPDTMPHRKHKVVPREIGM